MSKAYNAIAGTVNVKLCQKTYDSATGTVNVNL